MSADHYTYRVRWSGEDDAFVATVAEFPSLSWVADDPDAAFQGIRVLVGEVVDDMRANNEEPPVAVADRAYSGKFMVRLTPETHRGLAMEAAEQSVSLNRLVASRLTGA